MKRTSAETPRSPGGRGFILASVFLMGTAVLVLEILGARIISPYYGSSVHVWSAQITVTLAALAAGYWAGGLLADARPRADVYFLEILASGVLVLLIQPLKNAVLSGTTPLGLMAGSLASAVLLFAPALFVMSATGPLAIRLVTADMGSLGRGVGAVYALSTVGSVTGALLTGFVLVPRFPLSWVLLSTGVGLLALGGAGLWRAGRAGGGASALLAALLAGALLAPARPARATNVVFHATSSYGDVKAVDAAEARYLLLDGVIQGVLDLRTGEARSDYIPCLETLPLFHGGARRALVIGLGAGLLPEAFRRHHGLETDVVEIDPVVVRAAREKFGFAPSGAVAVEDGRTFVERSGAAYDVVVLDAFASERPPFHLFSREFFAAARRRMAPGGVLGVNLVGNPDQHAWHSVYKTVAAVFPQVWVFAAGGGAGSLGNIMIFASEAPLGSVSIPETAVRPALVPVLASMRARTLPAPEGAALEAARLFTDDFNTIDDVFQPVLSAWRRDVIEKTRSVLLFEG